jgi:hypothetical protein
MSGPPSSRPIAKRHQSFMAAAVLPGENPEEFAALFDEVWSDCRPVGPVEQSLVRGIASFLWRKRRLGIFRIAEAARKEYGEFFKDGDLEAGAMSASHHRLEKRQRSLERLAKSRELLEQVKPDIVAFGLNIDKLEKQVGIDPQASRAASAETTERKLAKEETETQFAILGDLISPECFIQELELRERLDAAIERAFDRLIRYQTRRITGLVVDRRPRNGLRAK